MSGVHDRMIAAINQKLDELGAAGDDWNPAWIANSICAAHQDALPQGEARDFYIWTALRTLRPMVTKVISERAGGGADDDESPVLRQIPLPGFERTHLQDYYVVRRGGEPLGIAITKLTDAELHDVEHRLRATSVTCESHADEIARYRVYRQMQPTAA